jgi:hypothetical protein
MAADLPETPAGNAQAKHLAERLLNGGRLLHRLEGLMARSPEGFRTTLLQSAFDLLYSDTMKDPQLWIRRLPLLPEEARIAGIASIARAWAPQAPEEAIAWAGGLALGESQNAALAAIASGWAKEDPQAAGEWVAGLPSGVTRDRSSRALVTSLSERFPNQAWDWALSIQDSTERQGAVSDALQALVARDPAAARRRIRELPFPPETKAELEARLAMPKLSGGAE